MKLEANDGLHQNLGHFLRKQREEAGLTQFEVAKKLGYTTPQFISNFERGICSPPLKVLKNLVKLYKMPAQDVIDLILKEQESALKSALFGRGRRAKS